MIHPFDILKFLTSYLSVSSFLSYCGTGILAFVWMPLLFGFHIADNILLLPYSFIPNGR